MKTFFRSAPLVCLYVNLSGSPHCKFINYFCVLDGKCNETKRSKIFMRSNFKPIKITAF